MNIIFRILLLCISTGTLCYVFKKIRSAQVQISSTVFWILFMFVLVIVSIFPGILINVAYRIGVESPANFVFLSIIFVLLLKVFSLSLHVSKLQHQIQQLTQTVVLDDLQKTMQKRNEAYD